MTAVGGHAPVRPPAAPTPVSRERRYLVAALIGVTVLGVAAVSATFGLLAVLGTAALALVVVCALRPVAAVYIYIGTLPFLSGIDRNALLPLLRPNEALLVLLVAGAVLGGYVRYLGGHQLRVHWRPLDARLGCFVLMSTVWPICWMLLRGEAPGASDLSALLPVCKLIGLLVLVRMTVRTSGQLIRLAFVIIVPAAVIAVLAVLQTLAFPPVVALLKTYWTAPADLSQVTERGSTTFASSIATGDYVVLSLALLLALGVRGLVSGRAVLMIGPLLLAGALAAGQFSTWASAIVVISAMLYQYPALRRLVLRAWPVLLVAVVIGLPAFVSRLSQFGDGFGVPRSWLGRWDNLVSFYLPGLSHYRWILGVSPNSVLQAPETWREVIYLEYGYLQFLWVGGLPLLAAFLWLSVGVVRNSRRLASRSDAVGAYASALWAGWWMVLLLSIIDIHLVLRGAGELLFTGLAIVSGALVPPSSPDERVPA